ncbi:MAG TPA: Spy/CpxP family protein refolding chaperone [Polyangiaceae bacterium]|jgi:Spy/CpxP family protein refolding chaperone
MKLSLRTLAGFVTLASAVALVPATAFAQDEPAPAPAPAHAQRHMHRGHGKKGLVGAALKLDSLTPQQRGQIEQLVAARKAAAVPVRQANAQLLTALAQQVEAGSVDRAALAPNLAAEQNAAMGAARVDQVTLAQLHSILTPEQRTQLVDELEARVGQGEGGHARKGKRGEGFGRLGLSADQKAQIKSNLQASRPARPEKGGKGQFKAALESFRGDSFSPMAMTRPMNEGTREVRKATAMAPVLTAIQRSTVADKLRSRAAREGKV